MGLELMILKGPAVERMPHEREDVGLIPAGTGLFSSLLSPISGASLIRSITEVYTTDFPLKKYMLSHSAWGKSSIIPTNWARNPQDLGDSKSPCLGSLYSKQTSFAFRWKWNETESLKGFECVCETKKAVPQDFFGCSNRRSRNPRVREKSRSRKKTLHVLRWK